MAKYSEYDYMFAAPKIAALSMKMPDDEKIISLCSVGSAQELTDRISEIGIAPVYIDGVFDIEKTLAGYLCSSYANLESFLPNSAPVKLMRTRYDAHNLKTVVKCGFLGIDPAPYLIDCGNVSIQNCIADSETRNFDNFGKLLADAANEAGKSVDSTQNARNVDVLIDGACFKTMIKYCEEIGFKVPVEFLRMKIDYTNILTFARIGKIKSADKAQLLLNDSIADGGKIKSSFYKTCKDIQELTAEIEKIYGKKLADSVTSSVADGTETLCRTLDISFRENIREKCSGALLGALPVFNYIIDLEYLVKNLRIIYSGITSNTGRDIIRERLRA